MKHIDFDGDLVCGVNSQDMIYCKIGHNNSNWAQIPGGLKYISVQGNSLYGVNA